MKIVALNAVICFLKIEEIAPFADRWDENVDQYSYSFKLENDLAYHDLSEIRPDQLPVF